MSVAKGWARVLTAAGGSSREGDRGGRTAQAAQHDEALKGVQRGGCSGIGRSGMALQQLKGAWSMRVAEGTVVWLAAATRSFTEMAAHPHRTECWCCLQAAAQRRQRATGLATPSVSDHAGIQAQPFGYNVCWAGQALHLAA